MPALSASTAQPFVKVIVVGDSGSGKTGLLISLVKAGYKLRVLDMDNKLVTGILPKLIMRECPDKISSVDYIALRDKVKGMLPNGTPMFDGLPDSFSKAMSYLDKWTDGTKPAEWGADTVFVLDSTTFLGDAAYNWAVSMNPSCKDPRQWYGQAQDAVENVIATLTSDYFKTNVVVIAHINYTEQQAGSFKGFPSAIGKALGPKIPAYFDNMIAMQIVGAGPTAKRQVQTIPTALLDLKNPAVFTMPPTLPIETGLADFFKQIRS